MSHTPLTSRFLTTLEAYRGWGKFNSLLDRIYTLYYRRRRETAVSLLQRKSDNGAGNIIIVCKGNVCRSAFLAEYLRTIIYPADRFIFKSAGFRTRDGSASPKMAQKCARRYGIDLSSHSGVRLTPQDVESADLIIGMEPIHHVEFCLRYFKWRKKFLLLRALEKEPRSLVIRDPFDKGRRSFQECFSLLIQDGNILVSALQEMRMKGAS